MATANPGALAINANSTEEEIYTYLLSISASITPTVLMAKVKALPKTEATRKLGILAAGASMNVRKVISEVRSKAGVVFPDDWLVNGDLNFSHLALLGHILYALPEDAMTDFFKRGLEAYRKSIGGAASLLVYTPATIIEGKTERTQILLKWSRSLSGFRPEKYRNILAAAFPKLVKDSRGIVGRTISSAINMVLFPFRFAYNTVSYAVSSIWPLAFRIVRIFAVIAIVYLVASLSIPNALAYIMSSVNGKEFASFPREYSALASKTSSDLLGFYANVSRNFPSLFMYLATGVSSSIRTVPSLAKTATSFAVNTYKTEGRNIQGMLSEMDYGATVAAIYSEAVTSTINTFDEIYQTLIDKEVDHVSNNLRTISTQALLDALKSDSKFLSDLLESLTEESESGKKEDDKTSDAGGIDIIPSIQASYNPSEFFPTISAPAIQEVEVGALDINPVPAIVASEEATTVQEPKTNINPSSIIESTYVDSPILEMTGEDLNTMGAEVSASADEESSETSEEEIETKNENIQTTALNAEPTTTTTVELESETSDPSKDSSTTIEEEAKEEETGTIKEAVSESAEINEILPVAQEDISDKEETESKKKFRPVAEKIFAMRN